MGNSSFSDSDSSHRRHHKRSKKRKQSKEHLLRKLKRLKKKLTRIRDSPDRDTSVSPNNSISEFSDVRSMGSERDDLHLRDATLPHSRATNAPCTPRGERQNPPKEVNKIDQPQIEISNKEDILEISTEIDKDILEMLGDDPTKGKYEGEKIHESLADRWINLLRCGLTRDARNDLLKKYPVIANCSAVKAPKINQEVVAIMSDVAIKRDGYQAKFQNQLGAGLGAIGSALNYCLNAEITKQKENQKLISYLGDAGKLLTDLHHSLSLSRRSFITPNLNKNFKVLADNSPLDDFLYGKEFGERLKTTKNMEKFGKDLKAQTNNSINAPKERYIRRKPSYANSAHRNLGNLSGSSPLNWKGPSRETYRSYRQGGQKSRSKRTNVPR